jgi:hypothetical protein
VRTGYLDAVAARTLGVAPLLRPATPSRFEPDGPTGRLEVLEIVEPAIDVPAVGPQPRAHPPLPPQAPRMPLDEPLLAPVEPDLAPLVAASQPAEPLVVEHDTAVDLDTAPIAIAALARTVDAQRPGPAPIDREAVVSRVDARPAGSARRSAHRRAAEPAWAPEEPAPPAVVVRIGRIDVRAESAPRTVTVPRPPAVQAGRSLADHLLARDRELS